MKKVRRIEITFETERVLSISRPSVTWCAACDETAAMVRVNEAAALADVSSHTIYGQMEAGRLHFTETPEGWPLICLNSLLKSQSGGR